MLFKKIINVSRGTAHTLFSILNPNRLAGKHALLDKILDRFHFREYDLPLHKDKDSQFLILLVGLMSFLAVLAFTGFFALNTMTNRWSSGLENKVTIEVLSETKEGLLRSNDAVQDDTKKVLKILKNSKIVRNFEVLGEPEMRDLIAPWIGNDLTLNDIPLPTLIAVELHNATPEQLKKLTLDIENISRNAKLNTHHDWLNDLTKLTSSLQFTALIIALIIGLTTITAISGGVRTRMAIHKDEVELLHLIGATDFYIARQLQRQVMILAFQGALIGVISGLFIALIVMFFSGSSGTTLIPQISLNSGHYVFLILLPGLISILAAVTARYTVLRELTRMP